MPGSAHDVAPSSAVGHFADALLADDLPRLSPERRRQTVLFIERRTQMLPSITRFGVRLIAAVIGATGAVIGRDRVRAAVLRLPLPLISDYPRLVRSLGYAYVWETWPETQVDGGTA